MGSIRIKLCNGFKVYNGVKLAMVTEDWQDVRGWLGNVSDEYWSEITRNVFACGRCQLTLTDEEGRKGNVYIEIIPCDD